MNAHVENLAIKLTVHVDETERTRMRLGDDVKVFIDAAHKQHVIGKVIFISPKGALKYKNGETKEGKARLMYEVKIEISNPSDFLKVDLPAGAIVETK